MWPTPGIIMASARHRLVISTFRQHPRAPPMICEGTTTVRMTCRWVPWSYISAGSNVHQSSTVGTMLSSSDVFWMARRTQVSMESETVALHFSFFSKVISLFVQSLSSFGNFYLAFFHFSLRGFALSIFHFFTSYFSLCGFAPCTFSFFHFAFFTLRFCVLRFSFFAFPFCLN